MRLHLFAVAVVLVTSTSLRGNVLSPGDTNVLPDVFSLNAVPPLLGSLSGTFNIANGVITGTWQDYVLVDPFGVTCPGCLDFAFEVDIDPASKGGIAGLNLGRFFGYTTDVGYVQESGGDNPITVSRGPFGGGISFNLIFQNQILFPGASTKVLVVATNATSYDTGGNLFFNGFRFDTLTSASTQISGFFEPTFVPEPSTLLFGFGIVGIVALHRRKQV